MTVLAGWLQAGCAWAGKEDYRTRLSVVSLVACLPCLHRGTWQIPIQHLPAIHRPWIDREEPTGCFVFSPLCRGVSHQLALERPGGPEAAEAGLWGDLSHDGLTD